MSYLLNNRLIKIFCSLLLSLVATSSFALNIGSLQLHGFARQIYLNTDGNNYLGDDTLDGIWDNREAGINLLYRPTNRSYIYGQLLTSNIGNFNPAEEDIKLDYLTVGYTPYSSYTDELHLRFGRVRPSFHLYSDALDSPATRFSILMPQAFYNDYSRGNYYHIRGLDLSWTNVSSSGEFELVFTTGLDDYNHENLYYDTKTYYEAIYGSTGLAIFDEPSVDMRRSSIHQLKITYSSTDYQWKIQGIYSFQPEYKFEIFLNSNQGQFIFHSHVNHIILQNIAIERYWKDWIFTFEHYLSRSKSLRSLTLQPNTPVSRIEGSGKSENFYIMSRYNISDDWELMLRYERGRNKAFRFSQQTWSLGVTWEPITNLKIQSEYHLVDGINTLKIQDNPNQSEWEKHWGIFAFGVSYHF